MALVLLVEERDDAPPLLLHRFESLITYVVMPTRLVHLKKSNLRLLKTFFKTQRKENDYNIHIKNKRTHSQNALYYTQHVNSTQLSTSY